MENTSIYVLLTLSLLASGSFGQTSVTSNTTNTTMEPSSSDSKWEKFPNQLQSETQTITTPLEPGMTFFYNIARGFINTIHTQELPYGKSTIFHDL